MEKLTLKLAEEFAERKRKGYPSHQLIVDPDNALDILTKYKAALEYYGQAEERIRHLKAVVAQYEAADLLIDCPGEGKFRCRSGYSKPGGFTCKACDGAGLIAFKLEDSQ